MSNRRDPRLLASYQHYPNSNVSDLVSDFFLYPTANLVSDRGAKTRLKGGEEIIRLTPNSGNDDRYLETRLGLKLL
jgi:hypothetical protein